MSAITETDPGGEMICILGFSARPRGADNSPMPGERRTFHVGERVRYLTSFFKATPEDNPTGHMAIFEPLDPDKNRYAATENYFVSLDCWEGLRKQFASTLVVMERDPDSGRPEQGAYVLVAINDVKDLRRQVMPRQAIPGPVMPVSSDDPKKPARKKA